MDLNKSKTKLILAKVIIFIRLTEEKKETCIVAKSLRMRYVAFYELAKRIKLDNPNR